MSVVAISKPLSRSPFRVAHHRLRCAGLLAALSQLAACSYFVAQAGDDLAQRLSSSIADHDDPQTVATALPAYLLLIDALVLDRPDDAHRLQSAATLYSAYTGAFVTDARRKRVLSQKALDYADRGACAANANFCNLRAASFEDMTRRLSTLPADGVAPIYTLGVAWAGWIQARGDDMNAVAELAQVEALMRRVVALDESHDAGGAHMYLGALTTLLPEALGGDPAQGREHFERAIALSAGRNLMPNVVYAERYARLVFDRELHDRVLRETLAADPAVPGYRLMNTLAQARAQQLLDSADEYF